MKRWVALIYSIFEYSQSDIKKGEHLLVANLFRYYKDFKNIRNNKWVEVGTEKKYKILETDCIRATEILSKCGLSIKLTLSKDKTEILIGKKH